MLLLIVLPYPRFTIHYVGIFLAISVIYLLLQIVSSSDPVCHISHHIFDFWEKKKITGCRGRNYVQDGLGLGLAPSFQKPKMTLSCSRCDGARGCDFLVFSPELFREPWANKWTNGVPFRESFSCPSFLPASIFLVCCHLRTSFDKTCFLSGS